MRYVHLLITVQVVLAFLFGLAVLRDGRPHESMALNAGRSIMVAGWGLLSIRCLYLMATAGYIQAPPLSLLALTLLSAGYIVTNTERLTQKGQTP